MPYFFLLFFSFFCGSFALYADLSFHYVGDLEIFYQEKAKSLRQRLEQDFGSQATLEISAGLLGVHGVSHGKVVQVLRQLREEERQQVLFELCLFTTPQVSAEKSAVFWTKAEQESFLKREAQKQIISRVFMPSRRGVPLQWVSEQQWVEHPEVLPAGNSLNSSHLFFQGAEVHLNTSLGEGCVLLEAQVTLKYRNAYSDQQESLVYKGLQKEADKEVWFIPFQKQGSPLYFMIQASLQKEGERPPVLKGAPISAEAPPEFRETQIYEAWEVEIQKEDHDYTLTSLVELYEKPLNSSNTSTSSLEIPVSCIEFFKKVLPLQFPEIELRAHRHWIHLKGQPQAHAAVQAALELQKEFTQAQLSVLLRDIQIKPENALGVYQDYLQLLAQGFSPEKVKLFLESLETRKLKENLDSRLCISQYPSWHSNKKDFAFVKALSFDVEESKIRTLSDTISSGSASRVQSVLLENAKECYLSYHYERNLCIQPFPEKTLSLPEATSFKIQEPVVFRESYNFHTFLPLGIPHCYWGLPLNWSSGSPSETLTSVLVQ
jgi:hypothetical protein